jgi:hypothetical protein
MSYNAFKVVHLLGVVLFLGNIIVTALWKMLADRTREPARALNPSCVCCRVRAAKTASRLATDDFSGAARHVGIGDAEAMMIHGLFALLARHVPASIDAARGAPRIRRRFRGGRPCCAESHGGAEHGERQDCLDVVFE